MMPRSEIVQFQSVIAQALEKADKAYGFEIMGSFRRGEMLSSDMDVVIFHPYVRLPRLNYIADRVDHT
jgi:DNA polymerase beta